jgi:hypothetical protein
MTTTAQIESNRRNAQRSTGPRSGAGKARASKNALTHGLRSNLPVIPGESPDEWEAHLAGILAVLAPANLLEKELASRVALCLWRLRRIASYEVCSASIRMQEAQEQATALPPSRLFPDPFPSRFPAEPRSDLERLQALREQLQKQREVVELWDDTLCLLRDLPDLPDNSLVDGDAVYGTLEDLNSEAPNEQFLEIEDHSFLRDLGVPNDELHDPWNWDGWTVGMVRKALNRMASTFKTTADKLRVKAFRGREETQNAGLEEVSRLRKEVGELEERIQLRATRQVHQAVMGDQPTVDKIMRYEAHITRQMLQALHTLERLQKTARGDDVPPPVALDVTVSNEAPLALPEA